MQSGPRTYSHQTQSSAHCHIFSLKLHSQEEARWGAATDGTANSENHQWGASMLEKYVWIAVKAAWRDGTSVGIFGLFKDGFDSTYSWWVYLHKRSTSSVCSITSSYSGVVWREAKVIHLMKILYFVLKGHVLTMHTQAARQLHEHLKHWVTDTALSLESRSVNTFRHQIQIIWVPQFLQVHWDRNQTVRVIRCTSKTQQALSSHLPAATSEMLFIIIWLFFKIVLKCHFLGGELWQHLDDGSGETWNKSNCRCIIWIAVILS